MLPEGKVWIAGAGPLPLLYATQFLNLGGRIAGYLDTAASPKLSAVSRLPRAWRDFGGLLKGLRWLRDIKRSGMMVRGFSDLRADGDQCLKYLTWEAKGKRHRVEADVLLVHEGIVPRIHETLALNCDHHWNEEQGYLAAKLDRWGETSREGLFVAGDAGGIGAGLPRLSPEKSLRLELPADLEFLQKQRTFAAHLSSISAVKSLRIASVPRCYVPASTEPARRRCRRMSMRRSHCGAIRACRP